MSKSIRVAACAVLISVCATIGSSQMDDPIVGRWEAVGPPAPEVFEFRKDGTAGFAGEVLAWKRDGDGYLISADNTFDEENSARVSIDENGLIHVSEFLILQKEGAFEERIKSTTSEKLVGQWHYVYSRRAFVALAASPDVLVLLPNGKVVATHTLLGETVGGDFKVTEGKMTISNLGPQRMMLKASVWLEDKDSLLIIKPEGMGYVLNVEWVFVPQDRIVSNKEVLGTWANSIEFSPYTREKTFGESGSMTVRALDPQGMDITPAPQGNLPGTPYFRLWQSSFGPAMTSVSLNPDIGYVSSVVRFTREGDRLLIQPIEPGFPSGALELMDHVVVYEKNQRE